MIKACESAPMEQPKPGMYISRCIKVIDIGTQSDEFQGRVKHQRKVWIQFELIGTQMSGQYNEALKGKPFSMSLKYTLSLGDRANLKKDLEAWRGEPFTAADLAGFDVSKIAGAPAYLNIGPGRDGVRMRINSINPVPFINEPGKPQKKMVVAKAINPIVTLSLEPDYFNQEVYDSLSEKLKAWIATSPEFERIMKSVAPEHDINSEMPPDMNEGDPMDDIPF
jgi:hypothetical protein